MVTKIFRRGRGLFLLFLLILAGGCGGSDDSGGGKSGGVKLLRVEGGGGEILIGQSVALSVQVTDSAGRPLSNLSVSFSLAAGRGTFSPATLQTDAAGQATTRFQAGAVAGPATVVAEAEGSRTAFSLLVRHPTLGEVLAGTLEGSSVALLPAIAAGGEGGGGAVLILVKGSAPAVDLSHLPLAGQLFGAAVGGYPAEKLPVVVVEAAELFGFPPSAYPTAAQLLSASAPESGMADFPVITGILINGSPVALGPCDAGAAGAWSDGRELENLVFSGDSVAGAGGTTAAEDLPVVCTDDSGILENPAENYLVFHTSYLPLFPAAVPLAGGAAGGLLPLLPDPLEGGNAVLLETAGAEAPFCALFPGGPLAVSQYLPQLSLFPLPVEYLPVAAVIQDRIVPDLERMGPALEQIGGKIEKIISTIQNNQAVIQELLDGGIAVNGFSDVLQYLNLANLAIDLLREADDIAELVLEVLDQAGDVLADLRLHFLPALAQALPEDGISFGGLTDGDPSSVRDDLLPLLDAHLALAEQALAVLARLVGNLESLLPDNLNLFSLIPLLGQIQGGVIDTLLADLDALAPVIQDSLALTLTQGLPILEDVVDEMELRLAGDDARLGEIAAVRQVFDYLEQTSPPGAMIGDLPYGGLLTPLLSLILPPEMGPPAELDLVADVLPFLEEQQVETVIIPLLREGISEARLRVTLLISALDQGLHGFLQGLLG